MGLGRRTPCDDTNSPTRTLPRLSLNTGHKLGVINEHIEGAGAGKKPGFGWGKLRDGFAGGGGGVVESKLEHYVAEEVMKKSKDEDVSKVGDFLSMVMDEHHGTGGLDDSLINEDDFFDVEASHESSVRFGNV
jgi:hypothetical protein